MNKRNLITFSLLSALQLSLPAQQETYQPAFIMAFENDMFNKMEWHYTNGMKFLFCHNNFKKSPFDRILMPFRISERDKAWYGISLRQELYTPRDLEDDTIRAGDDPYAAGRG